MHLIMSDLNVNYLSNGKYTRSRSEKNTRELGDILAIVFTVMYIL